VTVQLLSKIGAPLAAVSIAGTDPIRVRRRLIKDIVEQHLHRIGELTEALLRGEVAVF